jgi:G3E family GTPase
VTPTPVTVLGGYLGSGKTTRINELLSSWDSDPVAVVVNDFGAVNIDGALIRSRGADVLELQNGCVCCGPGDGMADVMGRLARTHGLGHVLIEVSGVGDPGRVAHWGRTPGFELHGVVVCADAETVRQRADDRWVADTVRAQLASADVVLLTKADLVDEAALARTAAWAGELGSAPVLTARDALGRLVRDVVVPEPAPAGVPGTGAGPGPGHDADGHRSGSASASEPVDLRAVETFLSSLPDGVVRGKGILRTTSAPDRRTVVQLVGRRLETSDGGPWAGEAASTLVLLASRDPSVPDDLDRTAARALGSEPIARSC